MRWYFVLPEFACWEGDGEPGQGGDPGQGQGQGGGQGQGQGGGQGGQGQGGNDDDDDDDSNTGQGNNKSFNQDEVNNIVAKRNKNLKAQYQQLETNYQKLLEQHNLSDEQRQQLEKDLENVQAQMRTKEQQLKYEKEQERKKHEEAVQNATKERDFYKQMFETSTIQRSITDAASTNDAYDPSQFVHLLGQRAKMVEELDSNGQKTGNLVPRIEWEVTDEEGTTQRVQKKPEEVINLMKEDSQKYGNLFKSNVAKGLGTVNQGEGGKSRIDPSKLSPEQYMELRKDPSKRKAMGLS